MIGYYNYTTILTYLSLITALLSTHYTLYGYYENARIYLLCCGFFDSFDGVIALGIQIDS